MKKYINSLFLAAMAVITFTACSSDDDYQGAEVPTNAQVYFDKALESTINISKDASEFTVPVNRIKADEAATVAITATDEDAFFTVPASVNFAAGETTANIVIAYDPAAVEYNEFHPLTLTIADTNVTTPYGASSYSFEAGAPYTFKTLGVGSFNDSFFFDEYFPVTIVQNEQNPNVYRVMNPYGTGGLAQGVKNGYVAGEPAPAEYLEFEIVTPGTVIYDIEITRSDIVIYPETCTGLMHPSYVANGSIYLMNPTNFAAFTSEDYLAHNIITEYFEDGTPAQIQIAPWYYMYDLGGFNYSQDDGMVTINMPGYDPKDYTLEGEYMGRLTAVDDTDYAQVAVEMGADLETVKWAVTDGKADDLLNAILDGSAEGVEEITESGTISIPLEATGTYQVVLVGYAEGEAVAANAVTVRFTSSHDNAAKFEEVGIGTFHYNGEDCFFEGDDPDLVISKSDANDGTYKISHWGYNVDFVFNWNETTNEVTVPEQFTGYTHSSYGDLYVSEADAYEDYDEEDQPEGHSYYDPATSTFHFQLVYYVSAGYFGFGEETFEATWNAGAKSAAKAKRFFNFQATSAKLTPKSRIVKSTLTKATLRK